MSWSQAIENADIYYENSALFMNVEISSMTSASESRISKTYEMEIGDHVQAQGCGQWREVHWLMQVRQITL